ncbi:MAG: GTP-binding protein, partial [Planctomycetota bacterium]
SKSVAVEKLGGGCACCTLAFAFKPLLAQFLRRTKPDRFILEPSGLSHPAKVVDILRGPNFSNVIDLRNIICLVDPKDFDDPRWKSNNVFQDQIQLADIVILNWIDQRDKDLIAKCRSWVEKFSPPKQMILETSFGEIGSDLLDKKFTASRLPLFEDAHPLPHSETESNHKTVPAEVDSDPSDQGPDDLVLFPDRPIQVPNQGSGYEACGWLFHADDLFDRDRLLDLLGSVRQVIRIKGVFHCANDWWSINRAKESTQCSRTTYRRDSRVEVIIDQKNYDWTTFESELMKCLIRKDDPAKT